MAQMDPKSIGALLKEGLEIRARMAEDKRRLAEINQAICMNATFKAGSMTGHVAADGVAAKVTRKQIVTWDQDKLKEAMAAAGPESFRRAFEWEFKPRSSRELQAWMASADVPNEVRLLVEEAKSVKEGAPSISYTALED